MRLAKSNAMFRRTSELSHVRLQRIRPQRPMKTATLACFLVVVLALAQASDARELKEGKSMQGPLQRIMAAVRAACLRTAVPAARY